MASATLLAYAMDPHPASVAALAAAVDLAIHPPKEVVVIMPDCQGTLGPLPYALGSVPSSNV